MKQFYQVKITTIMNNIEVRVQILARYHMSQIRTFEILAVTHLCVKIVLYVIFRKRNYKMII